MGSSSGSTTTLQFLRVKPGERIEFHLRPFVVFVQILPVLALYMSSAVLRIAEELELSFGPLTFRSLNEQFVMHAPSI